MRNTLLLLFLSVIFVLGCPKKPEYEYAEEYEEEEVVEEKYEFPMLDEFAEFEGVIDTDGDFTIKGKLKGVVIATGTVLVDETGIVECDSIVANNVIVKGHVTGNLKAVNEIRVDTTGIVMGQTLCKNLIVNGGSVFDAKSGMGGYKERRKK